MMTHNNIYYNHTKFYTKVKCYEHQMIKKKLFNE